MTRRDEDRIIDAIEAGDPRIALTFPADAGAVLGEAISDAERALQGVLELRESRERPGFGAVDLFELPYPDRDVQPASVLADIDGWARRLDLGGATSALVCLGIGGSSLGPRLLVSALADLDLADRVHFVDSVDPEALHALHRRLERDHGGLAPTAFLVTSKSGGTTETIAAYADVLRRLDEAGLDAAGRVTIVTGATGYLRAEAGRLGCDVFDVPEGVGGRWSGLSAVGLLPAAGAGIDIAGLLAGARAMDADLAGREARENPAVLLATYLLRQASAGRGTLCPFVYSDALAPLADWTTQLVMESIGKAGQGLTVLPARGTADQHSILQDLAQGRPDKVLLFIGPRRTRVDVVLPATLPGEGGPASLAGRSAGAILRACRAGTRASLEADGRPAFDLAFEEIDPATLGGLMMLLEWTTVAMAELLGVNAFDQPGVEDAKRRAREALGD